MMKEMTSNQILYLVFYDIGDSPTDIDDMYISWTDNLYYANMRASFLAKQLELTGSAVNRIKIVQVRGFDEITTFLDTFEYGAPHYESDIWDRNLILRCTDESAMSSVCHHGIWTIEEIDEAYATILNICWELNDAERFSTMLSFATRWIKDRAFVEAFQSLAKIIGNYLRLYQIRQWLSDDIISFLDNGYVSDDLRLVRESFKGETRLDIIDPNITDPYHGVFDETEVLIRIGGLVPVEGGGL